MKKSYSVLEKKLQEIEQAHAQHEEIKPKIEFLKNLISAELSPHSSDSIPPPLRSISKRLTRLESGYVKGKDYGTTSTSFDVADKVGPVSCFGDEEECDHQEDNNDPMPVLETVEASPVIRERTVSNYEANEKNGRLKTYWCCCLVMMMNSALFFVIGATLMLSLCGCSCYYYHNNNNNVRLQYATGFSTPT